MLQMTDTHCHLDLPHFDVDREAVVERARQAGISFILVPGTDLASSRRAVALAEAYPEVYAAVGVHPHEAKELKEKEGLRELRELAGRPRVAAIGEIGLDYYRMLSPRSDQLRVLQTQLELAADLGKPIIVHNRDATRDLLAILRDWVTGSTGQRVDAHHYGGSTSSLVTLQPVDLSTHHQLPMAGQAGVLHSFSASLPDAEASVGMGFYIGITGPITYRNGENMRQVAAGVPLERLLVETDSPFLMPRGFRGSRNEPAHVRAVAEKIAEVRGLPVETVASQTTANACFLFGLKQPV